MTTETTPIAIVNKPADMSAQIIRGTPDPKHPGDKSSAVHYTPLKPGMKMSDLWPDAPRPADPIEVELKKRIAATKITPDLSLPVSPSPDAQLALARVIPSDVALDDDGVIAAILRRAGGVDITDEQCQLIMTLEKRARRFLAEMVAHAPGVAAKLHSDALLAFRNDPDNAEKRADWEKLRDRQAVKREHSIIGSHLHQAFRVWANAEMVPILRQVIAKALAIVEAEVDFVAGLRDDDLFEAIARAPGLKSFWGGTNALTRKTVTAEGGVLDAMRATSRLVRARLENLEGNIDLPGLPSNFLRGIVHIYELPPAQASSPVTPKATAQEAAK